jgi:hypothetical protein
MSYIGNQFTSVPHIIDVFSGDSVTITFGPMVRAPAGTAAIAVFISGVYQTPGVSYSLNGDYIIFNAAPATGTNNIVIHHLGNGTSTQVPSDGSVTGTKLSANSVRGNNIVAGTITGNQIGAYAISGNQISTGAISANNFAGGGITSNVLSSNLTISTARISESINIVSSSLSGNYNVHISNSSVYLFTANASSNLTFNLVANASLAGGATGSLNDLVVTGNTVSVALIIKMVDQNGRKYRANVFVDGVAQQAIWTSNIQPQYYDLSQVQQWDMYNLQIIKVGSTGAGMSGGQYLVFASNTTFGYANGQGMGPSLTQ